MSSFMIVSLFRYTTPFYNSTNITLHPVRYLTTTPTGAILPEPKKNPFAILGVMCVVIPGIVVGALMAKNMAKSLKEIYPCFACGDDVDIYCIRNM